MPRPLGGVVYFIDSSSYRFLLVNKGAPSTVGRSSPLNQGPLIISSRAIRRYRSRGR